MNYSHWIDDPRSNKSGYKIHKITVNKDWHYHEHGHKGFHELVCTVDGSVRNIANGKEIVQNAGDAVLVRESDIHALAGHTFTYVNIMFPTDWLGRLEHYTQFMGTSESLMVSRDPPHASVAAQDQQHYRTNLEQLLANSDNIHGRKLFGRFLLDMVTHHLAPPTDKELSSTMPEWLRHTVAWIDDHRHTPPILKDAVVHSGRCHEHFTREFTRHLGIKPSLYLTNLRIDRAAEMLITTNNKIIDICTTTGFENESYFYRVFSQRKTMTPLAYRKAFGPRSIQKR